MNRAATAEELLRMAERRRLLAEEGSMAAMARGMMVADSIQLKKAASRISEDPSSDLASVLGSIRLYGVSARKAVEHFRRQFGQ